MICHISGMGMNLDREVLLCVEELEEKREPALRCWRNRPKKIGSRFCNDIAKSCARQRSRGHAAVGISHMIRHTFREVSNFPGFADGRVARQVLFIGGESRPAPGAFHEDRLKEERLEGYGFSAERHKRSDDRSVRFSEGIDDPCPDPELLSLIAVPFAYPIVDRRDLLVGFD